MTVTFRPLALREVLGLGRSIVRDFHPYELRGYRYAAVNKSVKKLKLSALKVTDNDLLFLAISALWVALSILFSTLL